VKRGRPRHPDILTPREWEVLSLLRLRLSNEQIARRLEITERTAKYHVAEILGKLGVANRDEAAAWQPERRRALWGAALAPAAWLWRKAGPLATVAGSGAVVAALGGLALLAFLLLRDDGASVAGLVADEERLAFSAGGSIYTVALDGSDLREVIAGGREAGWNASPAFSPGGERLVFTRDFDIWTANADGSDARLLADVAQLQTPPAGAASNASLGAQSVAWSPDGERLLYTLARIGGSGVTDVWAMQADGTGRLRLYESGVFLLASWLDSGRVAVYENSSVRVFGVTGEEEPPVTVRGDPPIAAIAIAAPGDTWVLAPFLDEGAITLGSLDAGRKTVANDGLSPALSPDGKRFAYFAGDTLRVAELGGAWDEAVIDLTPLGGRDRHFAEQPECFPDEHPACSYRPPLVSWWSAVKTYDDVDLGLVFQYPVPWAEGAPDSPVRPCLGCVVFGPPDADEPYGIRLYAQALTEDCTSAGCLVGNGRRQLGAVREVELDGRDGLRIDIMASLPLGLVDEIGGFIEYREVWTVLPVDGQALVFVAFWRDGDTAAREDTLAAYQALLASLRVE
jgi:DNA-binding CsgD family transcriptional regulator